MIGQLQTELKLLPNRAMSLKASGPNDCVHDIRNERRTESALVENIDMAQRVIDELRQSGIRIALDDFGTGYATLAQLQTLNLDKIKIDRRFVDRVVKDRESLVIVRAILGLASGFGLTTTAEGIEEDEQRACLQANGCLEGQGYLFSEAVPASSILALLKPAPLASTTA